MTLRATPAEAPKPTSGFTIAGRFGDPDAGNTIWPHAMRLKAAFASEGGQPFSEDLLELAFLIRGGGLFQQFNFEGHDNIVVNKKERWISVDIGVPIPRRKDSSQSTLAAYLSQSLLGSLDDVTSAAARKGVHADSAAITTRLTTALKLYTSDLNADP